MVLGFHSSYEKEKATPLLCECEKRGCGGVVRVLKSDFLDATLSAEELIDSGPQHQYFTLPVVG